jgi:16S rRNA (guanine527-N7)-methyltransferase
MKKTITLEFTDALRSKASLFDVKLRAIEISQLACYYELLLRWNPRLHLVAPCSPVEFAKRHVLESLVLLPRLKKKARVVDVGSGAGLPIIPCLVARSDITANLIESSPKKAIFLREALKHLDLSDRATVAAERFENLPPPEADSITCRALDRYSHTLPRLFDWSPSGSKLLLFGGATLLANIKTAGFQVETLPVPGSDSRYLFVLTKTGV